MSQNSIIVAAQRRAVRRALSGTFDFIYRIYQSRGREGAIKQIRKEVRGVGYPYRPQIYGRGNGLLITWHLSENGMVLSWNEVLDEVIRVHENKTMEEFNQP